MKPFLPAIGLALITIAFLVTAYGYPNDARAFPVVVAWLVLAHTLLDIVARTATPIGETVKRWLNPVGKAGEGEYSAGKQVTAVIWLAAFAVLMTLIGIVSAVGVYLLASLRFRAKKSLLSSAWIATSATVAIWAIFTRALQLELYRGILFGG